MPEILRESPPFDESAAESATQTDANLPRDQRYHARQERQAGQFFHDLYQQADTNAARIAKIKESLSHFFSNAGEKLDAQAITARIESLADAPDEETFVDQAVAAMQSILHFQREHPDIARRIMLERHKFTPLNEVLSYGLTDDGEIVHIHLLPTTDQPRLRSLVLDGLRVLARQIQEHPENFVQLRAITATSWIVAEYPEVMKRLGFSVNGPDSEEFRQRHFNSEEQDIDRASISKSDFLARYGA